jgi:hypothetical protein
MDLAVAGKLDLAGAISRRVGLDGVDEAYTALANGQIVGRALIEL